MQDCVRCWRDMLVAITVWPRRGNVHNTKTWPARLCRGPFFLNKRKIIIYSCCLGAELFLLLYLVHVALFFNISIHTVYLKSYNLNVFQSVEFSFHPNKRRLKLLPLVSIHFDPVWLESSTSSAGCPQKVDWMLQVDYLFHRMPTCVKGSNDFDVRDRWTEER